MSWTAPNLPAGRHCFFGSEGGVSEGFYQSLNVNTKSDDSPAHVSANLQIAADRFGLDKSCLNLLNQGVSNTAVYIDSPTQDQIEADGTVTTRPNLILCIRTADCAPVLLADVKHGVIGAAHAGWRGAFQGIIENTVDLMCRHGAETADIAAAVGPCIGQASYEVDAGFYDQFVHRDPAYAAFFAAGREAHFQFDLEAFCIARLKACGLTDIAAAHIDTYAETKKYYSFRRFTHQALIKRPKAFPTELSAIVL